MINVFRIAIRIVTVSFPIFILVASLKGLLTIWTLVGSLGLVMIVVFLLSTFEWLFFGGEDI